MNRSALCSIATAAALGCAPVAQAPAEARACYACEEMGAEQPADDGDGVGNAEPGPPPSTRVILSPDAGEPDDRWSTRSIGAPPERGPVRPARKRRVDVELVRAPFPDVARLLADAGKFDIVLDVPSARDVTVSLHDVEPYDALELIAEAQGLRLAYKRGVVIVSSAAAASVGPVAHD
jgi:hypothetical protein